ncbi:uncharacterized protein LTR77_011001 [Saxophila tyrrhenica]|uniref:Uncharacterized protein n=1 Tax=Saxophila tyrrhenica TaxID=1690608 RepID=A0AAV9NXK9_9PEZI|nr:hypothetical protein LTR77_011001 [Saxophila tyrrhenica]
MCTPPRRARPQDRTADTDAIDWNVPAIDGLLSDVFGTAVDSDPSIESGLALHEEPGTLDGLRREDDGTAAFLEKDAATGANGVISDLRRQLSIAQALNRDLQAQRRDLCEPTVAAPCIDEVERRMHPLRDQCDGLKAENCRLKHRIDLLLDDRERTRSDLTDMHKICAQIIRSMTKVLDTRDHTIHELCLSECN